MFMAIAITAIGIGIVVMVGYLVLGQVRGALPTLTTTAYLPNDCLGTIANYTTTPTCTPTNCASAIASSTVNVSGALVQCVDTRVGIGQTGVMTTAFAGLGLIAVGIIILAAFGLIQVFQ